jgi:tetratricopeptide (TPR) repeat protein
MLSMTLRSLRRPADALDVVASLMERFGTDYLLQSESVRLHETLGEKKEAKAGRDELRRLLDRVAQAYIELALDYAAAGRFDEALEVIDAGVDETGTRTHVDPMFHYYGGWMLERLGRGREARARYRCGGKMKPDYCFPSRVEAFAVLERAIALNPKDARARLYLGNLCYARERRSEAVAHWRQAAQTIKDSVVLFRNLAYAAWEREDLKRAIYWLRRALKLEPKNQKLMMPLVYIMLEDRRHDAVLKLLQRAYREDPESDAVREQYAAMLIDLGRPAEAVELLSNHHFRSRHGIFSLTRLHLNANIALGEGELAKGDLEKAFVYLDVARHIPVHLGEDELMVKFFGKAHYLAGECLEKMGRRKEARTCYRQCLSEADRGLPELQFYKCLSHKKLGHDSAAKNSLRRLAHSIEHIQLHHRRTSPAYLHYLRALLLEGQGKKSQAKKERKLAYRNGWRDSMAHDFAFKFGFS